MLFRSWQWRLGKTPSFDLELDPRFPWGGVQMLLTLKDGKVAGAEVYSDALDTELAAEVQQRLLGCRFESRSLWEALDRSEKEPVRQVGQYLLDQNL